METGFNERKPGGTIDSWCSKCKLMLAHTIEAMVGDKPARVHCNTCRSQHSYKPHPPRVGPRQAPKSEGVRPAGMQPAKPGTTRFQSLLKAKNTADAKTYSPKNKYETGDVLAHPTFGLGVTTAVKDGTKIVVLFESGSKTLVHAG